MELKPREGMPPLTCPYECTGDFEGGLHACSCKHNHNQNTRFRSITDCFYCIVVERRSTSMISNDTQSSSEYSDSQYY